MKRKPNCQCTTCHTPIYRRPIQISSGSVFCSLKCCGVSQRTERTCTMCEKKFVGAKRTCSRACANKRRSGMKYTGENKFNNARLGTLLKERLALKRGGICERCREKNYAILQVHHKIERHRGGTDAMSNLELLCPNCHATHHLGKSLFKK